MAPIMLQGYLSATEYHFQEEQADAIIRTASYHRKDYNLAVIWFPDQAPELQMQTVAAVRKLLPLSPAAVLQLASFKTLPETYTMEESVRKARVAIVPTEQAVRAY
ncbi:hypothetical protein V491_07677 [Pseudogymnoascus sp. VKM F-3775]|nr:hypothetical protein V491_07677 [Pseudogymnoascus sp. VKM F-3775]